MSSGFTYPKLGPPSHLALKCAQEIWSQVASTNARSVPVPGWSRIPSLWMHLKVVWDICAQGFFIVSIVTIYSHSRLDLCDQNISHVRRCKQVTVILKSFNQKKQNRSSFFLVVGMKGKTRPEKRKYFTCHFKDSQELMSQLTLYETLIQNWGCPCNERWNIFKDQEKKPVTFFLIT